MLSYTSARPLSRALRTTAPSFLVSRAGVLACGLFAAIVIGYDPPPSEPARWRIAADPLHNLLARWDTFWYFDIATRGYHWNGNPVEQQNVVFFPLLPSVMRFVGNAIGGHPIAAGFIVSIAAFALALAYLWQWTAERFDDETASVTVALLCAFPFSVFYSAVYTESIFLLAAVGAWVHTERRQYVAAAAFGLIAGLVRPNGMILAAPLAWIVWTRRTEDGVALRDLLRPGPLAAVAAPAIGALLYSWYLAVHVGDPLAWMAGQAAWPTVAPWAGTPPPDPEPPGPLNPWIVVVHTGNALALILALVAVKPVVRTLGVAAGLFILLNLVPPVARHGLQSLGRFTSVLFPIFVWLAVALPRNRRRLAIALFAAGQVAAAMLFFAWRPLV